MRNSRRLIPLEALGVALAAVACTVGPAIPVAPPPPNAPQTATTTMGLTPSEAESSPAEAPLMDGGSLAPGTYRVGFLTPLDVEFTVGRSWTAFEDWALLNDNGRTAVSFYRVVDVFADPCDWKDNEIRPRVGPTPADLIAAMARFPDRRPTPGRATEVSGWSGLVAEWSVPLDARFADCDDALYTSWSKSNWRADDFGLRFHQAPGQVDRIYALDIAGTRLVIDENWTPGTNAAELAELRTVVESITITR
jgi:hypothetical protein